MITEFEKQVARNRLREDVQKMNDALKSKDDAPTGVQNLNKTVRAIAGITDERSKQKSS